MEREKYGALKRQIKSYLLNETTFKPKEINVFDNSLLFTHSCEGVYLEELKVPLETINDVRKGERFLRIDVIQGHIEIFEDTVEFINLTIC